MLEDLMTNINFLQVYIIIKIMMRKKLIAGLIAVSSIGFGTSIQVY